METTAVNNKSQHDNYTVISDINRLMVAPAAVEHIIKVDPEDETAVMKIWVKDLTFLKMQEAIKSFVSITGTGNVDLDLAGYWKYMMRECIERTEPNLSMTQLMGLNTYIGQQITALLPQPQDLIAGPL
jgi:hypothetical protein|tara:strand:- start:511 stop:897 length:387 start_codon:yes stop_codon:yes gene_type:complete